MHASHACKDIYLDIALWDYALVFNVHGGLIWSGLWGLRGTRELTTRRTVTAGNAARAHMPLTRVAVVNYGQRNASDLMLWARARVRTPRRAETIADALNELRGSKILTLDIGRGIAPLAASRQCGAVRRAILPFCGD